MYSTFKKGDSVIVKAGTKEPDFEELDIGGWQGKILDIKLKAKIKQPLILIEWDSITLSNMPNWYILASEDQGYNWRQIWLLENELNKTKPRGNESQDYKMQAVLCEKHKWYNFGEQGKRISSIISASKSEIECFQIWLGYLKSNLPFPLHAIIKPVDRHPILKNGEIVLLVSINSFDDLYGILADIKIKGKKSVIPICDLKMLDQNKKMTQAHDDYLVWFSNQ